MPSRYSISFATVVMLVLLRLNIGWHFFSEGVHHSTDPRWTSEPTLRAATGPLANWFHAYLPDFHGFEAILHADDSQTDAQRVQACIDAIGNDWEAERQRFVQHYGLSDRQAEESKTILGAQLRQLRSWANDQKEALATHVHEWRRKEIAKARPAATDVPFERQRVVQKQQLLVGEVSAWRSDLESLEADYRAALDELLTNEQRAQAPAPHSGTTISRVDGLMTYFILAVGVLLLLGLFTRLACVAGAVFLLSVVMMQPFWVSDALPTYNQYVEMVALLVLATTPVGRWAGLDWFLHRFVTGSPPSSKGESDVLKS
ncbi:MAG: hypothetical protein AB7O59_18870 [Pirellulales bacterium]